MRIARKKSGIGSLAVLAVLAIALTIGAVIQAAKTSHAGSARANLTIIAPAGVGGGWDGFARTAQQTLRSEGIVNNVKVINIPGAGGTIGLSQFAQMDGDTNTIMVTGGVMVGAIELNKNPETFADVTPLARLADDYSVLVVPADSPYQNLQDLLDAWKQDPGGVSFAGGSLGSIDHLTVALAGKAVGIDPAAVNYIAYSGGGETLNALLSHATAAGISGYNEFADQIEAGTLRALAISSPTPLPGIDVPTFVDQGVDVTMGNWRGFLAPPGISAEDKAQLAEIIETMRNSKEWKAAVERNSWTDTYIAGDDFTAFLDEQVATISAIIKELNL